MVFFKGYKHSEEIRKKMSESHTGKSSGMKGKHHSEETKEILRKNSTGFKHNEKTKENIRKFHKGKILSEETKQKMSEAHKGRKRKPFKEETKNKISIAQIDLWSKLKTSSDGKREKVYINGRQILISHLIWEKHYGKIPDGYIIHHKDLNPSNNNINNLLMIERGKHNKLHRNLKK